MTDQPTERELALAARVKELEKAAAAGGGNGQTAWTYISSLIPRWLAVTAIAGFLAFHAWGYYNEALQIAAKTKIEKAKAARQSVEAGALNKETGGGRLRLQTLRAELAKGQADADRARAEADAQNAKIDGETMRLRTLQAQLAKTRADAQRAQVEAQALMTKLGARTLAERLRMAQARIAKAEGRSAEITADTMEYSAKLFGPSFNTLAGTPNQSGDTTTKNEQVNIERRQTTPAATTLKQADQADGNVKYATINTENLKLRACPEFSKKCNEVARMPQGLRVKILGVAENGWVKVEAPGEDGKPIQGYANPKYMSF